MFDNDNFLDSMIDFIDNSSSFTPHKRKDLSGEYILLQHINDDLKYGNVYSCQNGKVHGVWHPTERRVVDFSDVNYFKQYKSN